MGSRPRAIFSTLASDYGMLLVLLLLCAYYSWATYAPQDPVGADAARQVQAELREMGLGHKSGILIVTGTSPEDVIFAQILSQDPGGQVCRSPAEARAALSDQNSRPSAIVCTRATRAWGVFDNLPRPLATTRFITPHVYHWPNFLKADNLVNIANQIVVIAIIAVGMTMVIITAGIDLSVGSLIALSAVTAAMLIVRYGGTGATAGAMLLACLAGIGVCAVAGLLNGALITAFAIPPFIVTLGSMLIANGIAYRFSAGQSIYELPDSFVWLGRGTTAGLPNAVLLMLALYLLAHIFMTRTILGRYIYAVGCNAEASRLSGLPVKPVLLLVYAASGALAGLGGIVMASQLKSGAPTYGLMYELYVIAAVVVGGTSLAGGEGRILGTLIGAFIIAVIQNGMNLTGIDSYNQKIVLGAVILGAVLLDMLKRRGGIGRRA